ncbi:MAG: hypothetical protein ACK5PS_10975 [Desulfopila sp.]
MNNQIVPVTSNSQGPARSSVRSNAPVSFAATLQRQRNEQQRGAASGAEAAMLVGEISRDRQTVSELLHHNGQLRGSTWDILASPVNRDRDYTRLVPGTKIYYHPADGSLSWSMGAARSTVAPPPPVPVAGMEFVEQEIIAPKEEDQSRARQTGESQATPLGVIDRRTPTVSHLLKESRQFGGTTWSILSLAVNKDKDFTSLPVGTQVSIDPVSREIHWQSAGGGNGAQTAPQPATAPQTGVGQPMERLAAQTMKAVSLPPTESAGSAAPGGEVADLTEAVRPFFGRKYKEINCYELLVKGLERMNIQYGGKNGLFSKLTSMARAQGLPANAYLNGEGVVKAAGSLVLAKNYPRTGNWRAAAEKLYQEMAPLLDKGQILSFSTRRRGHTGIVGQQGGEWTFINSGRLDNSLTTNSPRQGVGEERLQQELGNWFRLASKNGESLSVTLGTLGAGKMVAANLEPKSAAAIPQRI